jgi:hypothetical protein
MRGEAEDKLPHFLRLGQMGILKPVSTEIRGILSKRHKKSKILFLVFGI